MFAFERRHVVTIDIEGGYLHGVMSSEVYMEISGQCLDILIYSYSDIYTKHVYRYRVYVKLSRALYGTIEAAKIWYGTSKLRKEVFTQYAYDNCVFNKVYNNNQLTF